MARMTFDDYMGTTKQLVEKSVALDNMILALDNSNVRDTVWVKNIKDTLTSSQEEIKKSLISVAKDFVG